MVLGAHNIPVASPDRLLELVTAFDQVRTGKVPAESGPEGKVTYRIDGFAFLMRAGRQ
jgi:hypothetical protein